MPVLKITKIGAQHAVLLSQEAMSLLGFKEGDHPHLSDTPDGELRVTLVDPQTAAQLKSTDKGMVEDWDEGQAMATAK